MQNAKDRYSPGDPVWAQKKHLPAWPAKVVLEEEGPNDMPRPKNKDKMYCVKFFGTDDYQMMMEYSILPYLEFKHNLNLEKFSKKKYFPEALKAIEHYIEISGYDPPFEYCRHPDFDTSEEEEEEEMPMEQPLSDEQPQSDVEEDEMPTAKCHLSRCNDSNGSLNSVRKHGKCTHMAPAISLDQSRSRKCSEISTERSPSKTATGDKKKKEAWIVDPKLNEKFVQHNQKLNKSKHDGAESCDSSVEDPSFDPTSKKPRGRPKSQKSKTSKIATKELSRRRSTSKSDK